MHTRLPLRLPEFDDKARYPATVPGKVRIGFLIPVVPPRKGGAGINPWKTAPVTPVGQAGKMIPRKVDFAMQLAGIVYTDRAVLSSPFSRGAESRARRVKKNGMQIIVGNRATKSI
jgi:hypothetical protein